MRWKRCILAVIVLAFLAAFPWGPLFAWSPVHPGYQKDQFTRADVLYPDSAALDPAYQGVDGYVAVAEKFHELKCRKRIEVVVCRNWSDCLRFAAPFLMGQRPLAVTAPTGTVIFVTPSADGWADIGGLLRHELSHAVQNQNRSLVLLCYKEQFDVELFCGITPLFARPTTEALRGIYRGSGQRRGARRPTHAPEELLQGIAIAR